MSDNQRTRPSEAEVTEAMVEAAYACGREEHVPYYLVRRMLAAALSTPPLPSAEPDYLAEHHSECALRRADSERDGIQSCNCIPATLYTTPPAAAQDTARLDWLEAVSDERKVHVESDFLQVGTLTYEKLGPRRVRVIAWGHANNTQGATFRAAIDNAMEADRDY